MAYWIDDAGKLREGDEEQGQRYGFRPATEDDLLAHNHALDIEEADTKGPLGLIGEGFQRGLGHVQDAARSVGFSPPIPGSEAFGPGGGLPAFDPPEAPPAPPGAETFPESFSEEGRLRTEGHPVYEGIGTGLAVAPLSGLAGAAAGALGGPTILGAAAGGIVAEQAVEAVAQEWDDAWLEQRPMELKNVAAYTAMFSLGDVLFRGVGKGLARVGGDAMAAVRSLTGAPEAASGLGARNIVAEAEGRAASATGRRPTQSVGAASASDMDEPFEEALATMDNRSAAVLARDGDDYLNLAAMHSADDYTRIERGLSEDLGSDLKYEDFAIGADAWSPKTIAAQGTWLEEQAAIGADIVNQVRAFTKGFPEALDFGNLGKKVANDIETGFKRVLNETDPGRRNYLTDQLKKTLDRGMMAIDASYTVDAVTRTDLKKILRPLAGAEGSLRKGLENPKYWGTNAAIQKSLNSPWHDLLQHWSAVQQKLYEATGATKFDTMGAGRTVKESTTSKLMGIYSQDPRALREFGEHLSGALDGYTRLVEARKAHGIVKKEGLDPLLDAVRNLKEDWNLANTVQIARTRTANLERDPRNWGKWANAAEKIPMGVGSLVGAARTIGQVMGDLNLPKGTALADVWEHGLRRYARHPALADASINQAYSDWMQTALRTRGAPIPDRRTAWGGIKDAATGAVKDHAGKVAGLGLFGLGAQQAATQQQNQDPNAPAQAGFGPAGLIGLGLAMMFKGKPRATFWHKAAVHGKAIPEAARIAVDALLEGEMEGVQHAALAARELPTSRAVAVELETIQDRIAARAREVAGAADPEQVDEYVKNTIAAEFASHAPRGGDVLPGSRVGALLGDTEDGTTPFLPELAQQFTGEHEALQGAFEDAAVRISDEHMPRFVEGLNHGLTQGWGARNNKLGGGGYGYIETLLRDPGVDPKFDFDKRLGEWVEDAEMFALDEINPWLARQKKPPLEALDQASRDYIRASILRDVSGIVQETEERYAGMSWRAGLGIRVRDLANASGSTIDWKEVARMPRDEAVGTVAAQAGYWGIPPSLRRPVAEDLVDAVAAGASPDEAGSAVARLINEGAEREPLGEKSHEQAAAVFAGWAEREGNEELGFNIIDAINAYAGDLDYRHINSFVRGAGVNPDRDPVRIQQMASKLQTALDYAVDKGYTAPGTTWRGVLFNNEDLARLDASDVAEAHSFMSTSADKEYAMRIIAGKVQKKKNPDLHEVLLEVVQKNGAPINPSEHEVLLRAGTRFRKEPATEGSGARWRLVELDTPPKVPRTLDRRSALPWVAGGVFTLGSLTAADKAYAAEPERKQTGSVPIPDREPPPSNGPREVYREAMSGIAQGGPTIIQRKASEALRRRPPKGRSPLQVFTGRRSLDDAVDGAREALAKLSGDPSALIDTLAGSVGELTSTHPGVYMSMVEKATGIVSYLSAEVPERTGRTLLDPEGMPPSADRSLDFAFKVIGATMPVQAMSDIGRLDAPPEELAAFQQHWPELWEPYRLELLGQTLRRYEAGRPVDGERLRKLDSLLGMDGQLDPSASMAVAQQLLSAQEQAPAASAGNSAPSQAPSPTGKAAGMFRTRAASAMMENQIG